MNYFAGMMAGVAGAYLACADADPELQVTGWAAAILGIIYATVSLIASCRRG